MSNALRCICAVLVWQVTGLAWSAGTELALSPPATAACLTSTKGPEAKPLYPESAYIAKQRGTVKVELTFASASLQPRVKVLNDDARDEFVDAVQKHAGELRLPCLPAGGAPVVLEQEYLFVPNDGRKVTWTIATEHQGSWISSSGTCATHAKPGSRPEYSRLSADRGEMGNVYAEMTFTRPDAPPEVRLLDPGPYRTLSNSVKNFVDDYRMPCVQQTPIVAWQLFSFRVEREPYKVLRDAPLMTFLQGVRNATAVPVFFDLNQMGCPFDVRLRYWQPIRRSDIGEVGTTLAARKPFLDWLSTLRINVPLKVQNTIIGDTMTISVPCGTIDL